MSTSDYACVLCGATLGGDERWPAWMWQFRALYSRSHLSTEAHLSGIGRQEPFQIVIPPGPIPDGHPVPDDGLLRIWLMRSSFDEPDPQLEEPHAWGFPFHESCWRIIGLVRSDDEVNIQKLFNIFRSFPIQDGIINFGHDYGGTACYRKYLGVLANPGAVPAGKEHPLAQGPPRRQRVSDPLELSELRRFFEEECNNREPSCDTEAHTGHAVARVDPFSKLPTEVLQFVFEYLPTPDVLHLKLASAACADVFLHQTFWMSRFLPGREFEAVFEARSRQHATALKGRWQSFYYWLKSIRQRESFVNRDRVWKLACLLWTIMDQVTPTSLCGDVEDLKSLRWVNAHTALKNDKGAFSDGSRALYHRTLAIQAGISQVFVSLVEINTRRYVSAIRVESAGRSSSVLGYQHPSNEIPIPLTGAGIAGFHLALDERGFKGLAVLSTSGVLSKWAGDHTGVPIRKLGFDLITAAHNSVRHLKCDFDALKIVSLSISDGGSADTAFDGALSLVDSNRWFPLLPSPDISILGIPKQGLWYYNRDTPITLAIFGKTPHDLETVSEITVRIAEGNVLNLEVFTNKERVGEFLIDQLDEMSKDDIIVESSFPENGKIVGFCSRLNFMYGLTDLGIMCRAQTSGKGAS